jgi:hypothetical protein
MAESFSDGGQTVSALIVEMREAIIELGGNRALFDTRDLWLERAARAAGISKRMAKSFFYNERCNPSSAVVESVRAARMNVRIKARNDAGKYPAGNIDVEAIERRLRKVEDALRLSDADAYRALVDEGGASQN